MITEYVSQVSDNHVVASTPPPKKGLPGLR